MQNTSSRLLASTALAGAFLFAAPAMAQDSTIDPAEQSPSGPVEAQPEPEVAATGEPAERGNDIIVTGSRLRQANLESAAPVVTVSSQDIKLSGSTRIEDIMSQLPGITTVEGASLPNPSNGTAEIDLRYLGSKRALTLVNGRRMAPGDPNSTTQAADLNLIPTALVRRAEVLTGGASSVYGADAVAGVVNFIIDTEFEGIRFDGQISGYQHKNDCPSVGGGRTVCDLMLDRQAAGLENYGFPTGSSWDGRMIDGMVTIGSSFDDGRGHAVGYFGYKKQNAVLQDQRDYSACNVQENAAKVPFCGGSSFSAEGNFLIFNAGTSRFYTPNPDGTLRRGSTLYNFAPLNHWIKPDERYTAGVFADYEISPAIKPYLEFMFMDDQQVAQIAPSGNFGNTFTISCDNPTMTAQARSIICAPENLVNGFLGSYPQTQRTNPGGTPLTRVDANGTPYQLGFFQVFKRNVEGGGRQADFRHTTYRGVLGTRGDLSDAFSYDAYYQYGRTLYSQVFKNEQSASRLARSMNAVIDNRPGSPTFGQPVCRSVLDGSDPACVPYDYFRGASAEALDYVSAQGMMTGFTSENIANINFTGQLDKYGFITPWASSGVGVNVGLEYRREALGLEPDQGFIDGDLTGQGGPTLPVDGSFTVKEIFAETSIPIIDNGFVDELTLEAGYRKSWYKTSLDRRYDTDTYKLSAKFAPIRDIRFRGSYNRAARAPNIQELFAPNFVALDGSTDPCSSNDLGRPIAATDYGCIAQFQAAGIANPIGRTTPSNPSEQYNGMLGGNPDLKPEKATTKTAGFVLQPRFLPRFALSVDYWDIRVEDAIQGFGSDTILADCVKNSTATSIAPTCALIHRDAGGSLWLIAGGAAGNGYVQNVPTNSAKIRTTGWDFNSSYSHRIGDFGTVSASFVGTRLNKYITDNGLAEPYDCAGYYGTVCSGASVASSNAMPKWRHKLRTTLDMPWGLGVSLNWRHVGKVKQERLSDDEALSGPANVLNARVKPQNYFDLAATYTMGERLNFRAGINNILDKSPPLIPSSTGACPTSSCTGNTYPGTWDFMGRYLYAGVSIAFKPERSEPAAPPPPAVEPPPPPPPPPATQTCADGSVVLATETCPVPPPPPPPPPPAPERG